MFKVKFLFVMIITMLSCSLNAQVKPVVTLDAKTSGGYYQNYFDLGEKGFIVVLNKVKNDIRASVNNKDASNTAYYFSKDLSKRTIIKYNSLDNTNFLANDNFIVLLEKNNDIYNVKLFDYNGKLVSTKKLDLAQAGLSEDKISHTFFNSNNRIMYEVYDLMQGVHVFYNDLTTPNQNDIIEADIALPSSNSFDNLNYINEWKFLCEHKGYYTLYRTANNKQYNPDITELQVAMYDDKFSLFRELSSNNILSDNEVLLGKDISIDLNIAQQSFILSYINKMGDKFGFSIQKLKFDMNNNSLKNDYKKDIELINNATNKFIETDGLSTPKIPVMKQIGTNEEIIIAKDRLSLVDEAINQICMIDVSGNIKYNSVQTGDFDMLNLDGFCGDNGKMYSRFDNLMMKNILKQTCECKRCEVLDIYVDENGNELLIIQNAETNIVSIYSLKK